MSFCRSHSRQKRICEEHKAELKEENFHLRSELQIEIRSISSRKTSLERGNSPDLYNSDDNMATITELANAIDGYVDNRTTTRDILID
ncbi:hypothetical protein GLOIN_2v1778046 [Rhizophagus irregularis DAOM 181602=DAOM 197198]|nr:hypothetical protein GLOIN_2v1778046 [Rhizophagus irregularis DAOM 181602=DAOM 197198]